MHKVVFRYRASFKDNVCINDYTQAIYLSPYNRGIDGYVKLGTHDQFQDKIKSWLKSKVHLYSHCCVTWKKNNVRNTHVVSRYDEKCIFTLYEYNSQKFAEHVINLIEDLNN